MPKPVLLVCVRVYMCSLYFVWTESDIRPYISPWHHSLEPAESRPIGRKGAHWGSSGSASLHNGTAYPPLGCSWVSTAPILPGVKKKKKSRHPSVSLGDGYSSAVGAALSKYDLSLYPSIRLISSSLEKLHLDIDIQAERSACGRSRWTNELWEDLSQDAVLHCPSVWLALHTDRQRELYSYRFTLT